MSYLDNRQKITYVLSSMIALLEYRQTNGHSPFGRWFEALDWTAAARIVIVLSRIERGNFSNVKGVGAGVFEYKLDFGPG